MVMREGEKMRSETKETGHLQDWVLMQGGERGQEEDKMSGEEK